MTRTECAHGHIYDADIHPTCPYCNSNQQRVQFDPAPHVGQNYGGMPVGADNRTAPIGGGQPGYGGPVPVSEGMPTMAPAGYQPAPRIEQPNVTRPPVGYQNEVKATESRHTEAVIVKQVGYDPVVGWLVAIDGPNKGDSYILRGRRNRIGRSKKMDVCLTGDRTISEENHAYVTYDLRATAFWLNIGDSTNNIYHNDTLLQQPTLLNSHDILDFGDTKLIFVPLCDSRFQWKSEGK